MFDSNTQTQCEVVRCHAGIPNPTGNVMSNLNLCKAMRILAIGVVPLPVQSEGKTKVLDLPLKAAVQESAKVAQER
ncbi:hypothetical protein IFR05_003713 [Cadophora sp. M221]|nr:hypothetical protein IFR05_003713 [Cadophora sp. M221]